MQEAIYDCSDSAEEATDLESRFNEAVDDKITIGKFVTANLKKEYLKGIKEVLEENGDADHDLSQTAMDLLFYP